MCDYCEKRKPFIINNTQLFKMTQPDEALILKLPDDNPGIVLFKAGVGQGYIDAKYCFNCGKKL